MEGWERAATAVAATTKGSNADNNWDKSLSPTSPPTTLSSTQKVIKEDFPFLRQNPNLVLKLEVERAKFNIEPSFETLWIGKEERDCTRDRTLKDWRFCLECVNGEKRGIEDIKIRGIVN